MKEYINKFASMFNDVSLTRGGHNMITIMACVWIAALIVSAFTGHLPDEQSIAAVTLTIGSIYTATGVTKHHKEKNV